MSDKNKFPTRMELDAAFHHLQDQITRIAVEEEQEMVQEELEQEGAKDES
ncbi:hypothetical protein ACF5W4_15715 [Bacillota bacterium Lsc_1132]